MPRLSLFLYAAVSGITDGVHSNGTVDSHRLFLGGHLIGRTPTLRPIRYMDDFLFSLAAPENLHHELRQI